ncbi:MAG: DNA polymerase [Gammaproteobacteria bacterium]
MRPVNKRGTRFCQNRLWPPPGLPDITIRNQQRRQAARRTAINAPMQGTAADIIKRAMLAVDGWLREARANARMIMLRSMMNWYSRCAEEDIEVVKSTIRELMVEAARLAVPLENRDRRGRQLGGGALERF